MLDLRYSCGDYKDYMHLECDVVWSGGCQILEGCSAQKMLRSKCYWSPSTRLQGVSSHEVL